MLDASMAQVRTSVELICRFGRLPGKQCQHVHFIGIGHAGKIVLQHFTFSLVLLVSSNERKSWANAFIYHPLSLP
jgi:hypothetical protein